MDGGGWILDQCNISANFAFGTRFLGCLENVLLICAALHCKKFKHHGKIWNLTRLFSSKWPNYWAAQKQRTLTAALSSQWTSTIVDVAVAAAATLASICSSFWSVYFVSGHRFCVELYKTMNPFLGFIFSDTDMFKYCIVLTWTLSIILFKLSPAGDLSLNGSVKT